MTSCAATTTIRETLQELAVHALPTTSPQRVIVINGPAYTAVDRLEQLVEAAQAVAVNAGRIRGREPVTVQRDDFAALAAAVAAVGPGQETT